MSGFVVTGCKASGVFPSAKVQSLGVLPKPKLFIQTLYKPEAPTISQPQAKGQSQPGRADCSDHLLDLSQPCGGDSGCSIGGLTAVDDINPALPKYKEYTILPIVWGFLSSTVVVGRGL